MSTVIIQRGEEERIVVDLEPVEKFMADLDAGTLSVTDELHIPQTLDREQMRFLVSYLSSSVRRYKRLWESSFSPGHVKTVKKLRDLKHMVEESGHSLGESWEILK